MTDAPEIKQEPAETQDKPVLSVPSPASAAPSAPSLGSDQLGALLADPKARSVLVESLRPEWQREIQSIKDKRIAELETQVARLQEGSASPEPVRGGTVQENPDAAYMKAKSQLLLDNAGIPYDDPQYKLLVAQYEGRVNPNQWVDIVQTLADSRTKKGVKQASVTPAAAAGGGGTAAPAGDVDSLTQELEEIQSGRRGSLTDPKLKERRKALRTQLAALTPQRPDIR